MYSDSNLAAPCACTDASSLAAPVTESGVVFRCQGEELVGVIARPRARLERDTGIVVVVGGPQYRAGSHRQFVQLARRLAASGWPVLRFDVRGMGDSSGSLHRFEQIAPDISAAIDTLCAERPGLRRVVVWGLCDAASAALLYLDESRDARVAGLILLNPWVRSADTLAQVQVRHYYARRLLSPSTWSAALRGRVAARSLADFGRALARTIAPRLRNSRPAARDSFQQRMAHAWQAFAGPTLLVLSGQDLTAQEFVQRSRSDPLLGACCSSPRVTIVRMDAADHTLSSRRDADEHEIAVIEWLRAHSLL